MKKVEIVKTGGDITMLFPFLKGDIWEEQSDGRFKKGIYSCSAKSIEDAIEEGIASLVIADKFTPIVESLPALWKAQEEG